VLSTGKRHRAKQPPILTRRCLRRQNIYVESQSRIELVYIVSGLLFRRTLRLFLHERYSFINFFSSSYTNFYLHSVNFANVTTLSLIGFNKYLFICYSKTLLFHNLYLQLTLRCFQNTDFTNLSFHKKFPSYGIRKLQYRKH